MIGDVAALSGDNEITDPVEQSIAWIFMQYGEWECSEPHALLSGNDLEAIEFVWTPRERPNEGQDFEMIGTLSSMFSRYYAGQTIGEQGVIQTEADLIPGWFAPLVDTQYKSKALPLWRFVLAPNRVAQNNEASVA